MEVLGGLLVAALGMLFVALPFVSFFKTLGLGGWKRRVEELEAQLAHAKAAHLALQRRVAQLETGGREQADAVPAPASSERAEAVKKVQAVVAHMATTVDVADAPSRAHGSHGVHGAHGADIAAPAATVVSTDAGGNQAPPPGTLESPPEPAFPPVASEPLSNAQPPAPPAQQAPETAAPVPPGPGIPVPASVPFEWEKWLGVRGAALAGGVVFALALLMLVRYSIEHQLISPSARLLLGVAASVGALVASERLRARYEAAAHALAGGGVVGLYAVAWAGHNVFHLVPTGLSFVLMVLTTAVCCLISVRHSTLFVAVLGLVGGFATPLLLSTGENRPFAFFGYLLMLDAAFVVLALKKKWTVLAALALVLTAIMQGLWIGLRMEPAQWGIALVVLALFALVFVAGGFRVGGEQRDRSWAVMQAAALLLPLAFALHLSLRSSLDVSPLALIVFCIVLAGGSAYVSGRQQLPHLATGAAVGSAVVFAVRLGRAGSESLAPPWWVVGGLALAGVFHLALESRRWNSTLNVSLLAFPASALVVGWSFFEELGQAIDTTVLWWSAGVLGLAAFAWRQARFPQLHKRAYAAVLATAISLSQAALQGAPHDVLDGPLFFAAMIAASAAYLGLTFLPADGVDEKGVVARLRAAALLPALFLFAFWRRPSEFSTDSIAVAVAAALLMACILVASARVDKGRWSVVAVVASAMTALVIANAVKLEHAELFALALWGTQVMLATAWPFFLGEAVRERRWSVIGAALAPPAFFLPLYAVWKGYWGTDAIGALPLTLALVCVVALRQATRVWKSDSVDGWSTAMAWLGGAALGLVALAVPLQLEKHWLWVAWALQGAALLLLWKRVDHAGLKYFALSLVAVSTAGLVLHPLASHAYRAMPRAIPVLNWTSYSYGVPVAAAWYGLRTLLPLESKRQRSGGLPAPGGATWGVLVTVVALLVLTFTWINVAIADVFSPGEALTYVRHPARDLTTSIAWAVYSLVLLGLGMWQRARALRWTSLVLLVVTLLKVFLYDLGHLTDLYRAASLMGLAMSLIAVSMLYRRFVFSKETDQ